MKKSITLVAIVFMVIAGFTSCTKSEVPKAGNAQAENMLKLLPVDADGVFFIDLKRAMETEFAKKIITEDEDIQAFIEQTNIDPLEDLFFLAGAVTQKGTEEEKEKVAIILNLKYVKENLLNLITEKAQEEGQEISEAEYEGYTLYGMLEDEKEISFAFIDESNILLGDKSQAQSIIDVIKKKKENFTSNKTLADLVSKTDKEAILWGAILFAPDSLDEMTADNPMLQDLKNLQAASIALNYKNQAVIADIKLMGGDETKNKNLADFLTGIKGFAGMLAAEKPEIGELMNAISITSGPENVQISANIPEALLNKLKSEIKPEESTEEIK
ncbi:MAG: hypothetical protein MUP98_11900 [Candidatus Aminicenantes bacterium]|nr:hypothetical protein [Candidatus Aminicenantes bacterium]